MTGMKRLQVWLREHEQGIKFYTALLTAFVVMVLLIQNHISNSQRTQILKAICGEQSLETCEPIDKLIEANENQTAILKAQNTELRDLQKLGICLMEAHGVPLPEGVENELDCKALAEQFASPSPNSSSPSANNDKPPSSNKKPKPKQGGDENPPNPPEDFDVPIVPEAIEDIIGL